MKEFTGKFKGFNGEKLVCGKYVQATRSEMEGRAAFCMDDCRVANFIYNDEYYWEVAEDSVSEILEEEK